MGDSVPLSAPLSVLSELRRARFDTKINGLEPAKQCLLEIIRIAKIEELELTNTCCHRNIKSEWKRFLDPSR